VPTPVRLVSATDTLTVLTVCPTPRLEFGLKSMLTSEPLIDGMYVPRPIDPPREVSSVANGKYSRSSTSVPS